MAKTGGNSARHAGSVPWVALILGCVLGLAVAAATVVLIGPLALTQLTGGSQMRIHSDAMAPALLPGDWVLAEELLPGRAPPRGAIVIYEDPTGHGDRLAMRVMGLPGERVQMRGGALYVDGRRAGMERLEDRVIRKIPPGRWTDMPLCSNDPVDVNGECRQELWRETLSDGTTAMVLNTRRRIGMAALSGPDNPDDTRLIRIPRDRVFVIGDNRDGALDSRMSIHGLVPLHKISHRIWMIHTSLDRTARFLTPRWDRFFRRVE